MNCDVTNIRLCKTDGFVGGIYRESKTKNYLLAKNMSGVAEMIELLVLTNAFFKTLVDQNVIPTSDDISNS